MHLKAHILQKPEEKKFEGISYKRGDKFIEDRTLLNKLFSTTFYTLE